MSHLSPWFKRNVIRLSVVTLLSVAAGPCYSDEVPRPTARLATGSGPAVYLLGPDDSVSVWVLGMEEISDKPMRIDYQGFLDIPLVGRLKAAGLTVEGLKASLSAVLKAQVKDPQITVNLVEFRSQPVSVIGEVNTPGIQQLQGHKTLLEMLSMAGGLRQTAGYSVRITRRAEWGPIPLPNAATNATADFYVAEVNLQGLVGATHPEQNIAILPNDVISVPRASMFYVLGDVKRAGAFVMGEKKSISLLQALSTAEGPTNTAATGSARLLRFVPGADQRTEYTVDLRKLLKGKSTELELKPEDILFVPSSTAKKVTARAIEGSIGLGTGLLVWR
ncbi:MAG: polysaccharide export protein [Bryobacterales bacterium]|nr:polysaccharide export protein [Bryobacterales bacterium]